MATRIVVGHLPAAMQPASEASMRRSLLSVCLLVSQSLAVAPGSTSAQAAPARTAIQIATAVAAGPATVGQNATVLAWPEDGGKAFTVLRPGSNEWFCLADDPSWPGNDAACGDPAWLTWYRAYLTKTAPPGSTGLGVGYMLTLDTQVSNTDPFAAESAPGNQWHKPTPHVMLLMPDQLLAQSRRRRVRERHT